MKTQTRRNSNFSFGDSGILARISQAYLHGADKNRLSRCTGNRVESSPMGLRNFYGAYAGLFFLDLGLNRAPFLPLQA